MKALYREIVMTWNLVLQITVIAVFAWAIWKYCASKGGCFSGKNRKESCCNPGTRPDAGEIPPGNGI
jgi:hypothetical protein